MEKICSLAYENWEEITFNYYMREFDLPSDKKIKDFSRGMKMELAIAIALSHQAELLILDEPTSGLDPVVRDEILEIFLDFIQDENKSILVSSHITGDLEKVADYITFIDDGEIVFSDSKDDILYNTGLCKCTKEDFNSIEPKFIVRYKLGKYGVEVLIKDIKEFLAVHRDFILEKPKLEEIMLLYIKGEGHEISSL